MTERLAKPGSTYQVCWAPVCGKDSSESLQARISWKTGTKFLDGAVPLKNVTSRFAIEKIKSVTTLPVLAAEAT